MNKGEAIRKAGDEFDEKTKARRDGIGKEQYGDYKFLRVNTLTEAMDEVLDLANYARYTYIKLALLREELVMQQIAPEDK